MTKTYFKRKKNSTETIKKKRSLKLDILNKNLKDELKILGLIEKFSYWWQV